MTVVRTDRARLARALRVFCVGLIALLAGCHGNVIIIYGTAVISMQDTSGQFLSYQVGVDSITLTRSDGIIVEPLTEPQTVDFTQITDIAELVGAPALPVGSYVSASIVLDYTAASIWVDENGQAVEAEPLDTSGTLMSTAVVTVTFDPNFPLVITSQQSSRLVLDLNLAASNTIVTSTSPAQVIVQPFMYATPAPVDSTPMRARGLYVTEMSITNGFYMNARPFIDQISALGAEIVNTTAQTYFNVNGIAYTGAAGLAELGKLPENSLIVAYGTLGNLSTITPTFNATAVYAGLVVQDPLADMITGIVSERSGDTIIVHGGTFFTNLYQIEFFNDATVTLSSGTQVSLDGSTATGFTADSVSVGQQVTIYGQGTLNTADQLSIDATAGAVRLQSTRLWGTLNSATADSASLTMLSLQNYEPAAFSFSGTGSTAAQDANPAAYIVNTGALNESGTAPGTLLQIDGVVSAFGTAPPDFTATAITPGTATEQQLVVQWTSPGSAAPFTSHSAAGLVVDLSSTNISSVHYIRTGPSTVDLTTLPASPLITMVPVPPGTLQLAIGLPTVSSAVGTATSVTETNSAANFSTAITTDINSTNPIYALVAVGQYDSTTNTFIASKINITLY
jgi:hypothetical protein